MLGRFIRVLSVVVGAASCFAAGTAFYKHVGLYPTLAFLKAPAASVRVLRRDWTASEQLQYTLDQDRLSFPRYVQSGLLPLVINGNRLSDSYPVAKLGGAITVVGATIVIVDRLGSFFRYDLKTGSYAKLSLPPLPNNLEAYLRSRSHLDGVKQPNLAGAEAELEFRAHDLTFLPDRKELAVLYDQYDEALGQLRTVVSVLPIDDATVAATGAWETKFTSETFAPGNAPLSGGRMAYSGENELYLSVGDHGINDAEVSQRSDTVFGKIIELNLVSKQWREVSKGHRNAFGLTLVKSGGLFATENGPRGGDGLDAITEGDNYGWPRVSLGTSYDSYDFTGGSFSAGRDRGRSYVDASLVGRVTGYTAPLFAWVPSIAPSQLIQIDHFDPRWDGDLLVGSMKGESLFRIRLESGRVLYSEPIWIGQRIRDLTQTGDGTIVLWTDDSQLLFLSLDRDKLAEKRLASAFLGDVQADGCLGCHHFGPTNPNDSAPTLSNLLNRPIASDAFHYSPGLRAREGVWTKSLLVQFLTDPTKFASGTVMPSMRMLGLDREQIENIVETLSRASAPGGSGAAASGQPIAGIWPKSRVRLSN